MSINIINFYFGQLCRLKFNCTTNSLWNIVLFFKKNILVLYLFQHLIPDFIGFLIIVEICWVLYHFYFVMQHLLGTFAPDITNWKKMLHPPLRKCWDLIQFSRGQSDSMLQCGCKMTVVVCCETRLNSANKW